MLTSFLCVQRKVTRSHRTERVLIVTKQPLDLVHFDLYYACGILCTADLYQPSYSGTRDHIWFSMPGPASVLDTVMHLHVPLYLELHLGWVCP